MLRMYLFAAAGVLLTRVPNWSGLKAWEAEAHHETGRRRAEARGHSAPHVDRRNRVQLVDEEVCRVARIRRSQGSRGTAGKVVPAGTVAVVRPVRFFARPKGRPACNIDPPASSYAPSCGGHAPTAERTVGPARMIVESLTPRPGIREHNRRQSRRASQRTARQFMIQHGPALPEIAPRHRNTRGHN